MPKYVNRDEIIRQARECKAAQAIQSFSATKRNRLSRFVTSPYFGVNNKVFDFIDIMLNVDASEQIELPESHKSLTDAQFRKIRSDAGQVLYDFIIHEQLKLSGQEWSTLLLQAIERFPNDVMNASGLKKAEERIIKAGSRSSDYFFARFKLMRAQYRIQRIEKKRSSKKTNYLDYLTSMNENLDLFYYIEKIRLYNSALTWSRLQKAESIEEQGQQLLKEIPNSLIQESEVLAAEIAAFKILIDLKDQNSYLQLKRFISRGLTAVNTDEAKDIFDYASNFCLHQINQGDLSYIQELLDLYKMGLANGVLLENNELSPWTFKNIISVALRQREFDWVDGFIEEFGIQLPNDFRESSVALAKAQLAFYRKNYQEVLYLLQEVEFKEFSYNTTSKSLMLASFYELDEYNLLEDLGKSFNKYLDRHKKLSSEKKKLFKNLIKFTIKLTRTSPRDTDKIKKIKKEIESTRGLASKSWLLEKVNELMGEPIH